MAYRLPKKSKAKNFQIDYADETFRLPVMSELPMNYLVRVQAAQVKTQAKNKRLQSEGQVEMMQVFMDILAKYAPPVAEDITTEQFEDLMEAWSAADEDEDGLGES